MSPMSLLNPRPLNQASPHKDPPPDDPTHVQIRELFDRVITLEARVADIRAELAYGPNKTELKNSLDAKSPCLDAKNPEQEPASKWRYET